VSSLSPSDPPAVAPARELDWDSWLIASWLIVVVLVVAHVVTGLWQWDKGYEDLVSALLFDRDVRFRVAVGGQYSTFISTDREVYRLFTSVLLHGDAIHLLFNAMAVVAIGRLLEPLIGPVRFAVWFTLGGVVGSVVSHLAGLIQSDGASGGAFALLGALAVIGLRYRRQWSPEEWRILGPIMWGFIGLNLVLSFAIPFLDAAGHVGGLVAGLVLGLAFREKALSLPSLAVALCWLSVFVGVCGAGFALVVMR
jgi:rhomboid protease GluP